MSDSEKMGRCFSEVHECRGSPSELKIADAIDRLAADVAEIKAKIDAVAPEDVRHFVESEKAWVAILEQDRDKMKDERNTAIMQREAAILQRDAAIRERDAANRGRDAALADAARLNAELAAQATDGNSSEITNSSPAVTEPAAPAPGWLTDEERHILSAHLQSLREQRRAMERGGQTLGYSANPCAIKREADVIDNLLARAGSPPVVEVPAMPLEVGDANTHTGQYLRGRRDIAVSYREALDKAGVEWREVPRG